MTAGRPASSIDRARDADGVSSSATTVGVLVVSYRSEEDLPGFFATLDSAVAPYPLDLVVVDNASGDRSPQLAREAGARVAENATNTGLAHAVNQAAAMTTAPWLLIVNPDTKLAPGSISRLLDTGLADDSIGCVGPRIETFDGLDYPTGRRFPSVGVGILHAFLGRLWPNNPATRSYFGDPIGGDVDWVSGSCMLLRRTAFDGIGGLDTGYFMYFEETDACLRLHRAGWRVVFEPSVTITHREGGSTRFEPFNKIYNHHRSALRFYCRYHRHDAWLLFTPAVAAGLVLRAAASTLAATLARYRTR